MTHSVGLDARDVMEVCQAVELCCAELYQFFAYLFKDDREKFLLWKRSAMEAENHARLFALVGKLRRSNMEFMQQELVEADVALYYVQALVEKVKSSPPPMDDALTIAIGLKRRIRAFMRENIIKFANQSCEKSFLAMTNSDSSYLESFQVAHTDSGWIGVGPNGEITT